jgi:LSD1 subclass zinc finger protein
MMFEQMFGMFIETAKGKPSEAIQPLLEQIAELKDNVGRLGGGFQGLPTNTGQLHGIIDYTKAMAEIKKTEHEFADKAANRELITTLAQTAFQSIGEAAASAFMQNPGTPEQAPVSLPEQPIDDGSVVSVQCPTCKALMTAPKGAPAIRCPSCNSVFDRIQQQKTPEEVAAISQEQLDQMEQEHKEQELATKPRKTFESPDLPREGPLRPEDLVSASPKSPKGAPKDDKEPGPLSRSIMNSKQVPVELTPPPEETASAYETDLSQPEEHPTSG